MTNIINKPRLVLWRTILLWFLTTAFINPIALVIATVCWWLVSPVNLGTSIDFIPRDTPLISLIRAVVFGIVAGLIIGIPQRAILQPFLKLRFWIPATIIGLAIGMTVVDFIQSWLTTLEPNWLVTIFIVIPPALAMVILQAIIITRAGHSPKWWFLAGGTSFAFPMFGFYLRLSLLGDIPTLVLGSFAGAILSAIVIPATFLNGPASPRGVSGNTVV